jgi:hypothetical protein
LARSQSRDAAAGMDVFDLEPAELFAAYAVVAYAGE